MKPRKTRSASRSRGGGDSFDDSAGVAARHRLMLILSGLFSLVALVVIIGFTLLWGRSHREAPAVMDPSVKSGNVRIASRFVSPSENEALALVKQALATRDPAMVETCMRPGASDPAAIVAFMAGLETRDGGIQRISWLSSMDVEGMLMDGVQVVSGKTSPVAHLAFLVPDEAGVWKMDFDAFARVSVPPWRDLLGGTAERARVRVMVTRDSYFNGFFMDESQWECYGLAAPEFKEWQPEGRELLRGYCRKETPQAKALKRMFKNGARLRRATLEIARVEGADPRQFEITRVLAEEWVLPEVPFDEKFD